MVRPLAALLLALVATPPLTRAGHGPLPTGAIRSAREAPQPGSSAPLPFFYDLYAFKGDTGTTTVVASFAVPVGRLDRESVDGGVRYRFNVTLVVADTAIGTVARADDSVFVAVRRPLDGDHLLHAHLETDAVPSSATVGRMIMISAPSPGNGQLYNHLFPVPDYGGSELMLSDIALGLPGQEGGWRRGGATLALMPSEHFPGGPFDVFYEVYNLPRGNLYTTEIAIEPADESGAPRAGSERAVRVSFSGESAADADGTLGELRRVDAPLSVGRHLMTVTVTDRARGLVARRTRLLQVREWEEGATLVPTCPVKPGVERPGCPDKRAVSGP